MSQYSQDQLQALNSLSPKLVQAGLNLGDELTAIRDLLTSGNLGISASSWDVDAVAGAAGAFANNTDTTSGLTWGHRGGRVAFAGTVVTVAAGTLVLSASSINYVEVDSAGTVSANTSAFTAGSAPIAIITTGGSSIASNVSKRALLGMIQPSGITGLLLSTPARTKPLQLALGTISATTSFWLILPATAGAVAAAALMVTTTITTSDTDYWTFAMVNRGPAGTGTTAMLDTTALNTTKVTGGSAITAEVARTLTLHGTSANLDTAANDVLKFTATKSAAAANLVNATLRVDFKSNN